MPQVELAPVEVRLGLLEAYIELLLQHEPLRSELDALYEEREKYPFPAPSPPHFVRLDYYCFIVNKQLPEEDEARLFGQDSPEWELYRFYKRVYGFCRKWRLPLDVWDSLFYLVSGVGGAEELRWWREHNPLPCAIGFGVPHPLPAPPPLPPFDPLLASRESYFDRVQQVVSEYCEQAEAAWRAAGWRGEQAFAHWRNKGYLRRLAKQAFWRVVLGWGWGAIRSALAREGTIIEDRSTIKRSTERAIEVLQLTDKYESFFWLPLHHILWAQSED